MLRNGYEGSATNKQFQNIQEAYIQKESNYSAPTEANALYRFKNKASIYYCTQ